MKSIKISYNSAGALAKNYAGTLGRADSLYTKIDLELPPDLLISTNATGEGITLQPSLYARRADGKTFIYLPEAGSAFEFLLDQRATAIRGDVTCTVVLSGVYDQYTTTTGEGAEVTTLAPSVYPLEPFRIEISENSYVTEPDGDAGSNDILTTFGPRLLNAEHYINDLTVTTSEHGARITANEAGIAEHDQQLDNHESRLAIAEPKLEAVIEESAKNKSDIAANYATFLDFKSNDYENVKDLVGIHDSAIGYQANQITTLTSDLGTYRAESKSYTDTKIADLIGGAPETLDTLKELSEALLTNNGDTAKALTEIAGNKTRLTTLETVKLAHDERLAQADANIATNLEAIQNHATQLTSAANRLTAIETEQTRLETKDTELENSLTETRSRLATEEDTSAEHLAQLTAHQTRIGAAEAKISDLIANGLSTEASKAANERIDALVNEVGTKAEVLEVEALANRMLNAETVNTTQDAAIAKEATTRSSADTALSDRLGAIETKVNASTQTFGTISTPHIATNSGDGVMEFDANYVDFKPKGSAADFTLRLTVPTSGSHQLNFNSGGTNLTTDNLESTAYLAMSTATVRYGYATSSSTAGTVIGTQATTEGGHSGVAVGYQATATGQYATAIGGSPSSNFITKATGNYSVAIGLGATVSGPSGVALGYSASTEGYNQSTAIGYRAANTAPNQIRLGGTTVSSLSCAVSLSTTSDERDKTDISPIDDRALELIKAMRPVTYRRNTRADYAIPDENGKAQPKTPTSTVPAYDLEAHQRAEKKGERQLAGLLAQEIQKALIAVYGSADYADIVDDDLHDLTEEEKANAEGNLSVKYDRFVPFLIKAVQKLAEDVETLKNQLANERS